MHNAHGGHLSSGELTKQTDREKERKRIEQMYPKRLFQFLFFLLSTSTFLLSMTGRTSMMMMMWWLLVLGLEG